MLDQMRAALSAAAPTLKWEKPRSALVGNAGCESPFSDVPDANAADYDGGPAKGNIPDAAWPAASQAVIDIAA